MGLAAVSLAFAQTPAATQSDTFHITNCATPCVAELALTQVPTGDVSLFQNGVQLDPHSYQIDTSEGPTQIIVSFSASVGTIQSSDLIVATYPVAASPGQ